MLFGFIYKGVPKSNVPSKLHSEWKKLSMSSFDYWINKFLEDSHNFVKIWEWIILNYIFYISRMI